MVVGARLFLGLCLAPTAWAADPPGVIPAPAWTFDGWVKGSNVDHNGWESGYAADSWDGEDMWDLRWVASTSSDAEKGLEAFGIGGPKDNWLVRTDRADVEDAVVVVTLAVLDDDDTAGVLFHYRSPTDFYLFLQAGPEKGSDETIRLPLGLDLPAPPVSAIVRVKDGVAEVLASDGGASYEEWESETIGFRYDDGEIAVFVFDGTETSDWSDPRYLLEVVDDDPVGPGTAGLYAYSNNGAHFQDVTVWLLDEDADGVADDDDNCEKAANADQADADADGKGDVCDEPEPDSGEPDDSGDSGSTAPPDDSGESDSGDGGDDTSTDTSSPEDDATVEPVSSRLSTCACASSPRNDLGAAMFALVVGALIRVRRRHTRGA